MGEALKLGMKGRIGIGLTLLLGLSVSIPWWTLASTEGFMPHGNCYLWTPWLVAMHVGSDSLIGLAYFAISLTLIYLVIVTRKSVPFRGMFVAFGIFIVACGGTHWMAVWTVWNPDYWASGHVKMVTALASVATAVLLPVTVPKIREMISAARLSEQRKIELEQAYEELEKLYHHVSEVDRAKSELFANVSHELRTPLTLILGPTEELLKQPELGGPRKEMLRGIHRNARLVLDQVNNLLDTARFEAGKMGVSYSRVEISGLIRRIIDNFEASARQREISLRLEAADRVIAEVDAEKVARAVFNLLGNATKFVPDGGVVRCRVAMREDKVRIEVDDNGPGVPGELRDLVFERFRQGEAEKTGRHQGSGLGLSLAKEMIEIQGGMIELSDSELGGARFVIALPLSAPAGATVDPSASDSREGAIDEAARPSESSVPSGLPVAGMEGQSLTSGSPSASPENDDHAEKPRLLIVEDNPEMRQFLVGLFESDYSVRTAENGRVGLELAERSPPDLVVLDIMMPTMPGDQFVLEARKSARLAGVPIMILSAKADDRLKSKLLRKGAQDYVVKPFVVDELKARVANLLETKGIHERLQQEVAAQRDDISGLLNEVLDRKQEAERLNLMLTSVLESFPEYVWVMGKDGRVDYSNRWAKRLEGAERSMGRRPPELEEEIDNALIKGQRYSPTDHQGVYSRIVGHREHFFLPRVEPVLRGDDEVQGAVVLLTDITEMRLLDEMKTDFLRTVGHELRTPTTSVRTSIYLLLENEGGRLSKTQLELLVIARDEIERLMETFEELVKLTRFDNDTSGRRF